MVCACFVCLPSVCVASRQLLRPSTLICVLWWKTWGALTTTPRVYPMHKIVCAGPQQFKLKKLSGSSKLPVSHTCFNRLDLPDYTTYEQLRTKLLQGLEFSAGFDVE